MFLVSIIRSMLIFESLMDSIRRRAGRSNADGSGAAR